MIDESKIFDIPKNEHFFDHEFLFFRKRLIKTIEYLSKYNLQNVDYIRITHSHEIYVKRYFNLIDKFRLNEIRKFINETGLKGIIFRDNNITKHQYFNDIILHQGYPYFLGMTTPNRFRIEDRKFDKKFLCLNLQPRPYRLKILEFFYKNNISENSYLTHNFSILDNDSKTLHLDEHLDSLYENPYAASSYIPTYLNYNSFCNVVTETCFYGSNINFITEKTEKCFSAGQPFIIISNPYFLKKLKELGYKTFSDFWDESYDEEEDDEVRMEMIFDEIKKINLLSYDELSKIYSEMIPILKHNQKINSDWYLKNLNK